MLIGRRAFLTGLGSLLAAPAIVHAGNLMPVRSIERLLLPAYDFDSFDMYHVNTDVAYQWVDNASLTKTMTYSGWSPVPSCLFKNQFQVAGDTIQHGGCTLMQKSRLDMENARASDVQAARDLGNSWKGELRVTNSVDYFHSLSDFGVRKL